MLSCQTCALHAAKSWAAVQMGILCHFHVWQHGQASAQELRLGLLRAHVICLDHGLKHCVPPFVTTPCRNAVLLHPAQVLSLKQYLQHVVVLQEGSPRFVASTAVASQAAEPQPGTAPEDDASYIVWLEHINGGNYHSCPPSGNLMTEHAVMQHMNRMHLANVNTGRSCLFAKKLSWLQTAFAYITFLVWYHNDTLALAPSAMSASGLHLPRLLMTQMLSW